MSWGSTVRISVMTYNAYLKAEHPLFDWLRNCVISNHF